MGTDIVDKFQSLIMHLTVANSGKPLVKVDIPGQFRPADQDGHSAARSLNAAFLIALSGKTHPLYGDALSFLERFREHPEWGGASLFYLEGLGLVPSEVERACEEDSGIKEALDEASARAGENPAPVAEAIEKYRGVFFPEGVDVCQRWEEKIAELREKRKVTVTRLNPDPVRDPATEILFTSNILITTPIDPEKIDGLALPSSLKERLKEVVSEEQLYWYDHPIPVGVEAENNEALYGLRGLDEAVAFEKQRGTIDKDAKLACALSVSVTHEGLQDIAKEYLEEEFNKGRKPEHLDVYVFTEADTSRLIGEVLAPAIERYAGPADIETLRKTVGVDGEYGRHYTFLKAVSALWHVLIDSRIRGTFKTDLDQVFPQDYLVRQSGASALEHLKTPLWGAEGVDCLGRKVELGMLAGALVNQKDISKSLFYPDVCLPTHTLKADELVFFSQLPQALSTEAEMMTRYSVKSDIDGVGACIQRIHVTGGTNGILVESLRRHRPFTPVFIGRAEDQAYIMSVLFGPEANLRYVHKDGLIMRHDKEAFAGEAVKAAKIGKLIGDYTRILWFSYYSRALPWPLDEIKSLIDPFTGCFVSRIPLTVVYLRFALKTASLFDEDSEEGLKFFRLGTSRLRKTISLLREEPNPLIEGYLKEKRAWHLFYDALDHLEEGIKNGDGFALELQGKAKALVEGCRMSFR